MIVLIIIFSTNQYFNLKEYVFDVQNSSFKFEKKIRDKCCLIPNMNKDRPLLKEKKKKMPVLDDVKVRAKRNFDERTQNELSPPALCLPALPDFQDCSGVIGNGTSQDASYITGVEINVDGGLGQI